MAANPVTEWIRTDRRLTGPELLEEPKCLCELWSLKVQIREHIWITIIQVCFEIWKSTNWDFRLRLWSLTTEHAIPENRKPRKKAHESLFYTTRLTPPVVGVRICLVDLFFLFRKLFWCDIKSVNCFSGSIKKKMLYFDGYHPFDFDWGPSWIMHYKVIGESVEEIWVLQAHAKHS